MCLCTACTDNPELLTKSKPMAPDRTCAWCTDEPATRNVPMPGRGQFVRLYLCDGCERVVARQIHIAQKRREAGVVP